MTLSVRSLALAIAIAVVVLVPVTATSQSTLGPREDHIYLVGTRLTYVPRPSVDQCQSDCANNGKCQGFTWIKAGTYNPGDAAMCYLMSAVTRRNPARGHISAVKGGGQVGESYSLSATSNARSGETISVSFTAPSPSAARDWIGLFKVDAKNNDHGGRWKYTEGRTSGTLTFTAPAEPGQYEFRYLLNDGYTDVRARAGLTVTAVVR
jgi:hypothetical protein